MNNKIKAAEVSCLIDGNEAYDKIYQTLKESLPSDEEMIFAERTSGSGFLQWELPQEGWVTLEQGDPIQAIEVKKELERRIQLVRIKFGDNQVMADKVLSYPDDSYVYFKYNAQRKLQILLTAWGYRHPERIEGIGAGGWVPKQVKKEPVSIHVVYAGKSLTDKPFLLNGTPRKTDAYGTYEIGKLPIDYEFEVDVDGKQQRVKVVEGEGHITIDATIYADIEVKATLDGQPYGKASVKVDYCGQQMQLVTDGEGCLSIQLPLSLEEQKLCTVAIDAETQIKPLSKAPTHFVFDIVSPKSEPLPEPEPVPEPVLEPVPEPEPESKPEPEPKKDSIWPSLLFGLALALLVATTFYFGWNFL